MDIGSFVSYDDELEELMEPQLQPPLPAAGLADLERFLAERPGQYPLEWVGGSRLVQRHGAVEGVQ